MTISVSVVPLSDIFRGGIHLHPEESFCSSACKFSESFGQTLETKWKFQWNFENNMYVKPTWFSIQVSMQPESLLDDFP